MLTIEELNKRLYYKHNDKIKLLEYSGMDKLSLFKCNICGYEWRTQPNSVINQGTGCGICLKTIKYNFEYVKNYIELYNCVLLSDSYDGIHNKLIIKMICSHIDETSLAIFMKKKEKICSKCVRKNNGFKIKKSEKEIIEFVDSFNFNFIEFPEGYKNIFSLISYSCKDGHITKRKFNSFKNSPKCYQCEINKKINNKGELTNNWKGGITELRYFIANQLKDWKKESMKNCNFKCVITGKKFEVIHHIYGFNIIIQEVINSLNIPIRKIISEYSQEEINSIVLKTKEIHNKYPLGVCLTKKVHNLFHKLYGKGNNNSQQWYDFKSKIENKEIGVN